MIIDADTHIAPTGGAFAIERHLERMARSGVDRSVCWLRPDYQGKKGIEEHNAYVYRAGQDYPEQILGFGWVDPTLGVEHARDLVRRCAYDHGFYGIKLNGAESHFHIDDPELALPVIEEIARTGRLLAFHIGPDGYEHTHPLRAARVASRYPEMTILMVHMGQTSRDLNRAAIEVAQEHPNVALIGSSTSYQAILQAIKTLGADRVCFGTDAPFRMMHVEAAIYDAMLDGEVTQEERRMVMGGNIARLLGL